ncbi:MAG: hypothetical protein ACLQF0_06585 [Dissulfurispiraceae bacterium]
MQNNLRLDAGQIEVVDDAMAEVLKRKSPSERIGIGFSIWSSAYNMLTIHLKKTHPGWSAEMLRREVNRRLSHGSV